jgi:hypothetical protein
LRSAAAAALIGLTGLWPCAAAEPHDRTGDEPRIRGVSFTYRPAAGLGRERGVIRRDPSDVIKVGDTHYVYYSKVAKAELPDNKRHLGQSGYPATIWYASSKDGLNWTERGEAVGLGKTGTWDSFGVFTPNILQRGGKFWLYYTGVRPTPGRADGKFENNSENDFTAIGVAVGDTAAGPFDRVSDRPVLTVSARREAFDSYRVDDACLVVRGEKVWLYYKGRSLSRGNAGPKHTQMGVALGDGPAGPFAKLNGGEAVQNSGHEVQIWRHGEGVMSLVSPTGPNGRTLQYAADGVNFNVVLRGLQDQPKAPGLYRPELVNATADMGLPQWGISMMSGGETYLRRTDCRWTSVTDADAR